MEKEENSQEMQEGTQSRPDNSEDICVCGDYRSDHDDNGVCKLNGLGHNIPDYKCEKFRISVPESFNLRDRAAMVAINFAGQTIDSYDGTYTLLIDCIYDALLEVAQSKDMVVEKIYMVPVKL